MSATNIAPQTQQPNDWESELAEIRTEVEREMEYLVTEDDTPVDNIFSEKQQHLLTEPHYGAWVGLETTTPG